MGTLHRYLLRQVTATLLLTAGVFTAVLLLGNVLREILPLLLNRGATLGLIARALGLLIPFVWVFALPMGMLTATLLVFGRFSADQELTAARGSGISLVSLTTPILVLSLTLCGISMAVNLDIAPRCRVAYNNLRFNLKAALTTLELPEGRLIYDFPGYTIFVRKNRHRELEDVFLYKPKNETNLEATVYAPRGRLEVDEAKQLLILKLYEASYIDVAHGAMPINGNAVYPLDLSSTQKAMHDPGINDMTFHELQEELRKVQDRVHLPGSLEKIAGADPQARERRLQKQLDTMAEGIQVQIHRRFAFSFACFGFTLIGIPLGIRMHRRETNVGVAVALGLVAVYYGLIVLAESLSGRPEFAPHLLIWLPNFLFQAVGAVLLWRANRGG